MVMPCPSCGELVVLFREKVIALNRTLLEKGSQEERKAHLAGVISEFLDPSLFKFTSLPSVEVQETPKAEHLDFTPDALPVAESVREEPKWSTPISDREFERFTKFQLKRLDNVEYFRRHFKK
ncbi:MAG: hypothetical protein IID08_03690 [Candidatus Hydrogenedentes bacterium]|nr:hypothetical protein [Candidatus Hydrogenedentota bacterium]